MLNDAARKEICTLIRRYPALEPLEAEVTASVELLTKTYRSGNRLFICGNGGSAADSVHIVGELMKSFARERPLSVTLQNKIMERFPEDAPYYLAHLQGAIPCASLVSEISLLSAYSNDCEAELAYAQQIVGQGSAGDALLAISTSGNSRNVLHAARIARAMDMQVLALTGQDGGALRALADILMNVPAALPYQVQEYHLPIYHAICLALEAELFDGGVSKSGDTTRIGGKICMS